MASPDRAPSGRLLLALVVALAPAFALALIPGRAAAQADVIRGRVTGVDGQPLPGVRVTATSVPGNVTRATQTNERGSFQIAFPDRIGDYIVGYAYFGYAFRQLEVKRLADEDVLLADARLAPIQLDSLLVVGEARQRVERGLGTPDVSGTERAVGLDNLPPELRGDLAAMAASLPGVTLVPGLDGGADGFSVLGLGADENSVTLNGLPSGTGNLPRDAAISTSLTTSPYDGSRGGFSGGNFAITSRAGSNFGSRGASLVFTSPQVQWTDAAGRALGNDYTNFSLSGMASGPIRRNKAFYNVSYQLGRMAQDNPSLLRSDALGLRTAGVATDSVARLLALLRGYGVPLGTLGHASRLADDGRLFGAIDFQPPRSASGQALGITFNGNWRRQTAVGGGTTALESSAGDHIAWQGAIQARHSGYVGMILSETSLGVNASRDHDDPYLALPTGQVRVASVFDDGTSGLQSLTFGGSRLGASSSRALGALFQNSLSWFDNGNKHRLKLGTEAQFQGNTQRQAGNLLGTFSFNSLEELEAGAPASFSRTLTAHERSTGQVSGALSLTDSYRVTPDLQLQGSVRVDASRYTRAPANNPLVESTFGRRNDEVPSPVAISPRLGLSWTVGKAQEISSFSGAARAPRAVIRGGIGVFSSLLGAGQLASALENTGLPDGGRQLFCVGSAVPTPDWAAYAGNVPAIPERCADGSNGTVFSSSAPNVSLFAREFAPPRSVRSDLSWSGSALDGRFSLRVAGTYSLNLERQRSVDLNFRPTPRFTLGDDGRPVFVEPSSIVAATGAVAPQDARISPAFSRVSEMRSDLRSRTAQLQVNLSPIARTPTKFGWSAAYTYTKTREQLSGFASTAGSPLGVQWVGAAQSPHQFSYSLRYTLFDALDLVWSGSVRSGTAFTPTVSGDVNGDGYWNDRAFVASPSAATDPALAAGMRQLLAGAPSGTRRCLERQMGQIAGANSCMGPWTSGAALSITLDRARFRMPERGAISFSLSNPLGAADLLLHGSGNLKGWGQPASPDSRLLYVRGFDAATRRYHYEVNQRFGAARPQVLTLRSPAVLTINVRVDLGPTREQQVLRQQLSAGGAGPGARMPEGLLRSLGPATLANPMAAILRAQDSLALTALQADSIAAMNRRYTYRADSLWAPVARYLAGLPARYDESAANGRYLQTRRAQVDLLTGLGPAVRRLLTPAQRRKLPGLVVNYLDPRYLSLIRTGTRMYVGTGGSSAFFGGGMPFAGSFDTQFIAGGMGQNIVIIRSVR